MCEHKNIVRLQNGWYCTDCKTLFSEKPIPVEVKDVKPKVQPKKKKVSKGAE